MSAPNLGRRKAMRVAAWLGGSASGLYVGHALEHAGSDTSNDVAATLLKVQTATGSALDTVKFIDQASTGLMLTAYGGFLPNYMRARLPWQAADHIGDAIAEHKNPKSPHRMAALPAVVAAHGIAFTGLPERRAALWDVIEQTLKRNSTRETREIILQNLVTASLPSADVQKRWHEPDSLLACVAKVIKDAAQAPQLLSAACIALTYLLNARLRMQHSGTADGRKRAAHINRLILTSLNSRADHLGYLRKLKADHEKDFAQYSSHDPQSLPSQPTEMILQSHGARKGSPNFNETAALIHARVAFEVWRCAVGDVAHDPSLMSKEQAITAWPKLVEFELASGVQDYLPSLIAGEMPKGEHRFKDFLSSVLRPKLAELDADSTPTCRHMLAIRNLPIPLFAYRPATLVPNLGVSGLGAVGAAVGFALAHFAIERAGHAIDHRKEDGTSRPGDKIDEPNDIAQSAFNAENHSGATSEARAELAAIAAMEADKEAGDIQDEIEGQIGPIELPPDHVGPK